jgi:sugar phosphate isomerase/epimerase
VKAFLLCDSTNPQSVVPRCHAESFGIEIQAFYHPTALEDRDLIGATAAAIAGIAPLSVHGPFGDLCPGSFDPRVRDLARSRFEQARDIAVRLNAQHLVLHHCYVPHTTPPSGWLPRSTEFWCAFLDGVPPGISVHLENLLELDTELIAAVIDAIDRPNLDIALDIGHSHCRSHLSVVEWIEALGDRIGYVHLHDNCGQEDEHLALGEGTIPVCDVISSLEGNTPGAVWALEVASDGVDPSLRVLRDCGVRIGRSPDQ